MQLWSLLSALALAYSSSAVLYTAFLGIWPQFLLMWLALPPAAVLLLVPTLRRLLLGSVISVIALAIAALYTPCFYFILPLLVVRATPQPADAIVVLAGGINCKLGILPPASLERLEQGVRLWRAGYADTLVFSQQSDALTGPNCPKISELSQQFVYRTYPYGSVHFETLRNVMNTYDESREAARVVHEHHWHNVLLVTSALHSRRASLLFARQGIPFTSVPVSLLSSGGWQIPSNLERITLMRELEALFKGLILRQL
ncbi:YdcF family protein (plasmid) [Deinococcus sp. KNUC1210]|uniref:YdcF family protein n=1 Tax=Deinococcus sp. KNUC1210 TaxID=2917691 RepID=UPI001EF06C9C|nr:YdcF family protein [Deinococcus sp. KNUC1210]ULH14303.1 YdcF family protein [Deinococcus sp. KNUC1210]